MNVFPVRRSVLIGFLAFTLILWAFFSHQNASKASRIKPNIILISIDALRPDHLGVYGYKRQTSPFMDAWISQNSWTTDMSTVFPVTSPSFAALMTGRHPFTKKLDTKGKYAIAIDDSTPSLPKIFKKNGYTTAAFVTNRILWKDFFNIADGFDVYDETDMDHGIEYEEYVSQASDWLIRNHEKPFFYWIHLMEPHAPYDPPEAYRCSFTKGLCDQMGKAQERALEENRQLLQGCKTETLPDSTISMYESLYDGEIKTVDDSVQSIIDKIITSGLDKNSIIMLYSDHGEGFDHEYYFEHGETLYNSSQRILFALHHPTLRPVGNIRIPTQNIDISPTLLDLAEIPHKQFHFDGRSMGNFFRSDLVSSLGRIFANKRYLYGMNENAKKFSIYDGTHKYIYSLDGSCLYKGKHEELYNTSTDPEEEHDIRQSDRRIAETLRKKLLQMLSTYGFLADTPDAVTPPPDRTLEQQNALEKLKSLGY